MVNINGALEGRFLFTCTSQLTQSCVVVVCAVMVLPLTLLFVFQPWPLSINYWCLEEMLGCSYRLTDRCSPLNYRKPAVQKTTFSNASVAARE